MKINSTKIAELFDLKHTLAGEYLSQFTYPWEALSGIGGMIVKLGATLPEEEYYNPAASQFCGQDNCNHGAGGDGSLVENIWIARSARISSTASITGPCIIGPDTEVRHNAFIRGNLLAGSSCVIGNSCEIKNVIMFDNVQVPHFNYAGDSILGYMSHMGAGSITSNFKSDHKCVTISNPVPVPGSGFVSDLQSDFESDSEAVPEKVFKTGLQKVGAFLGDYVEVGCNSVLNPGTIIGRNTTIYPTSSVRGIIPADSIFKSNYNYEIVRKL